MSTKKTSKKPAVQEEGQQEQQEQTGFDPNKEFKTGFMVGLQEDGHFFFQIYGKEKELATLAGVHKYAEKRIEAIFNEKLGMGDILTIQVGQQLSQLTQQLQRLLALYQKPENKLE